MARKHRMKNIFPCFCAICGKKFVIAKKSASFVRGDVLKQPDLLIATFFKLKKQTASSLAMTGTLINFSVFLCHLWQTKKLSFVKLNIILC